MRRLWCLFCYYATLRHKFWIPWCLYIRMLPWAGEEAYRRGEL
jgi:hypothetical protein